MQEYINIRPEQNEFEAFTENLGERENIFWLKKDTIKPAIFIRPLRVEDSGHRILHCRSYKILPYDYLVPGERIAVFRDPNGLQPVCHVWVLQRYWEPAQSSDWPIKTHIDPDNCILLHSNMEMTEEEYRYLCMGIIPEDMDFRTATYVENDILYFIRSWSSHCMFEGHIYRAATGQYRFSKVMGFKYEKPNLTSSIQHFNGYVKNQIDYARRIMEYKPPLY
ncbi:MAG: hypothetical protein KDC61_02080 [Saprospiraceae bacterium]|nr:hypothetical protein [Sinomicrobium sp.]MCB0573338.1 hypothetical protein [Saprospiraceae bacterium]MCB9305541.1 hypothetical protein [Lewinellaceae bacterium]MCB9355063.1 hypothetical protein [Lewinellaceae bacterium]